MIAAVVGLPPARDLPAKEDTHAPGLLKAWRLTHRLVIGFLANGLSELSAWSSYGMA
jgi:hypothetical protein